MAHFIQTGASFSFCVENISNLIDFRTPEVLIQDIPWCFNIVKKVHDNEEWIAIYLDCKKADKSRDWGIAAASSVQLISSVDERHTIEWKSEPFIFDYRDTGYGNVKFIKWSELLEVEKGFITNDKIHFKVKIEIANPHDENASKLKVDFKKHDEDVNKVIMQITINNIHNLMAIRTFEFVLQNLRCDLTVFKDPVYGLGLRLDCKEDDLTQSNYYKATVEFNMKSLNDEIQNIEKSHSEMLQNCICFNVYPIISWNDLINPKNGFIVHKSISFEVIIKMDKIERAALKRRASNPPEAEPSAFSKRVPVLVGGNVDQN